MGAYQRPIGELKKFAKQFQGVLALVPLLENLDTLGNEEIEKTRLVGKLREEVKSANAKLLKRRKEWDGLEDKEAQILLDAEKRAEGLVREAHQEAERVAKVALGDSIDKHLKLKKEIESLELGFQKKSEEAREIDNKVLLALKKLEATNKELDRLRSIL